jgi:hypothetical protein
MLVISVPLALAGYFVMGLLPPFELPEGQFWRYVDDLVLDLPVNWAFIVMAPVALIFGGETPQTVFATVLLVLLAWAPMAVAYSWFTRRVRLRYVLLGVYPIMWFIGIGIVLLIEGTFGYAGDTSI